MFNLDRIIRLVEASEVVPLPKIIRILNKDKNKLVGKVVSYKKIASVMKDTLLKNFYATINIQVSKNIPEGMSAFGGGYDEWVDELRDNEYNISAPSIQIFIFVANENEKIQLGEDGWKKLVDNIANILQHELLHRAQATKRDFESPKKRIVKKKKTEINFKINPVALMQQQEYLGTDDEIEAYALNIAQVLKNFPEDMAKDILKTMKTKRNIPQLQILKDYVNAFGKDHLVTKRLFKKIWYFYKSRNI